MILFLFAGYLTLGWGWFLISKEDVAEYGSIAGKYISSTKQRLYAKNGFSLQAYTKMAEEIENRKITLKVLCEKEQVLLFDDLCAKRVLVW